MTIFHDIFADTALYLPVLLLFCGLSSYFLGWKRTFILAPFVITAFLVERSSEKVTFPMILYAFAYVVILWTVWITVLRFPAEKYEGTWTFTDEEGTAFVNIASSDNSFILEHNFNLLEDEEGVEYELREHWRHLRFQAKNTGSVLLEFCRKGDFLKVTKPGMDGWEILLSRQKTVD